MPKRVIDFDAMWASDKLAACAEWAQPEYAWLYGLADCAGCFELTNLRVIWGRVSAIRRNFSLERLEQVFDEFHAQGLLFIWSECGKRYGHWTGSDVPGRLPPPSWRNRLERLAPPVPCEQLAEYVAAHSAGVRARGSSSAFAGALVHAPRKTNTGPQPAAPPLNLCLESPQAQGLDLDWEGKGEVGTHTHVLEDREKVCESAQQPQEGTKAKENPCLENIKANEIGFCGLRSLNPEKLTLNEADKAISQKQTQTIHTPGFSEPGLQEHESGATNGDSAVGAQPFKSEGNHVAPSQGHALTHDPASQAIAAQTLGEIWEQERGNLSELRALTPERLARCRERLSHARDGARFLADFREAVRRAAATPFLCGAGPAGWRANFDWIVANDTNYMKVLEGRYDAVAHGGSGEREDFARREVRAGAGPVAASGSMRIRGDVMDRALKRG